jgi:transposase
MTDVFSAFSYSPDINMIELIWAELKRYVRKKACNTTNELVHRIQKFFQYKLTVRKCRKYIRHLRRVLLIIIED